MKNILGIHDQRVSYNKGQENFTGIIRIHPPELGEGGEQSNVTEF